MSIEDCLSRHQRWNHYNINKDLNYKLLIRDGFLSGRRANSPSLWGLGEIDLPFPAGALTGL